MKSKKIIDKVTVMGTIAILVTLLAVLGTPAIACMIFKNTADKGEAINQISQTLLPLWSTWFGTILAFYFSKQNLAAATESNQMLMKELSERDKQFASKSVLTVMMPVDEIKTVNIAEHGTYSLSDILGIKEFAPFNRFPVFNAKDDKKLEYMIHRIEMLKYLYNLPKTEKLEETEKPKKTLNDFLSEMQLQSALKDTVGFVSETANLLDVKKEMDRHEKCEDVFVTKDGKNSSEVIGWISDHDIYKHGRV